MEDGGGVRTSWNMGEGERGEMFGGGERRGEAGVSGSGRCVGVWEGARGVNIMCAGGGSEEVLAR